MKNDGLSIVLELTFVVSLLIYLGQDLVFPTFGTILTLILHIIPALCIQILMCRTSWHPALKALPLILTTCFALWGFWLYMTSPSWQNATLGRYFADYVSPAISCALVWIVCAAVKRKG